MSVKECVEYKNIKQKINNLEEIKVKINHLKPDLQEKIKIIAVSKTFLIKDIEPLIEYGHQDFWRK